MQAAPRLACEQCRSRKVRCNKASPCSSCKSAGLHCHTVQRARLPRGKSGNNYAQRSKLEERVTRIESLLAQNGEDAAQLRIGTNHDPPSNTETSLSNGSTTTSSLKINAYCTDLIASDFWAALSEEVNGLREIIESSEDDTGEEHEATRLSDSSSAYGPAALIFSPVHTTAYTKDNIQIPLFNTEMQSILLGLYRQRVDSVYKILHWPSVLSMFENSQSNLSTPQSLSSDALQSSIYFMAICSISASEAEKLRMGDRNGLLQLCREHLEALFAASNLLNSPDMILLQAFVTYLIGLRACSNGAYTWTLVAVAVRVATALKLGEENPVTHTAFELQIRRRLLFGIAILDTHSALDRGTIPILPSTALTAKPLNINDAQMSPPHDVPTSSGTGITDMSHTAMIYEAMLCQRRLYESSLGTDSPWDTWHHKLDLVKSFERYVQSTTSHIADSAAPLARLLKTSGHKILISLQLLLRRPPYRQPRDSVPPWDDFDVAKAATDVLEQHLQPLSPELEPWAWKNWIQWHALAVVLAELATKSSGPESDRAYAIAKKSFDYYAQIVADSESGMLWKPIAKLRHRVDVIRQGKRTQLATASQGPNGAINVHSKSDLFHSSDLLEHYTFETPSWTLDGQGYNDFTIDEQNGEVDMPWLAWDAFLQDMNLTDV